jgi:hypothetical protein
MRLVGLLVSSVLPLVLFSLLRLLSISRTTAVIYTIAAVVTPLMVQHSVMATGDVMSITLAFMSLALVVRYPHLSWREVAAGILMAAAVSCKLTSLNLVAAPIVYLLAENGEAPLVARVLRVFRLAVGFAAGLLMFFPYLWTDPFRTAKAIVGNVDKLGSHADLGAFLKIWSQAAGIAILALTLVAWLLLPIGMRDRQRRPMILALGTSFLLVAAPLLLRATTTFGRYYLPLVPLGVLLLAATCSALKWETVRRVFLAGSTIVLVVACGAGLIGTMQGERLLRADHSLPIALRQAEQISGAGEMFVPEQARLAGLEIPPATYDRIHSRLVEELSRKQGLSAYLEARGLPPTAASTFESAFDEKERAAIARANAMRISSRDMASDTPIVLWCDYESSAEIIIERTAICEVDRNQVRRLFLSSPGAVILVPKPDSTLGEPLFGGGERWVWYRNTLAR